jgi:ADP-ribosylglycohydrolase
MNFSNETAVDPAWRDRVRGCMLGGAVGDALGAAVEFLSLEEIRHRYGAAGIQNMDVAYGRRGAITDDTQMTIFTAEGLLRAIVRHSSRGICHPPSVVHRAYLRWLRTQGFRPEGPQADEEVDGWVIRVPALHSARAPGNTCLSALRSGEMGSPEHPINDSKGCGTVMRVAPVGLLAEWDPFRLGCEVAAITHGHPTGILAAGALAEIVHAVARGAALRRAVESTLETMELQPDHGETSAALHEALKLADAGNPSAEAVESLGAGWVAEEALAIAVYCALVHPEDFAAGVRLAVNHGGDSDSTGAIAGNLLGAALGASAIPAVWVREIELREEITALADDLATGFEEGDSWWERYPGW